jgi:hypothetical protein
MYCGMRSFVGAPPVELSCFVALAVLRREPVTPGDANKAVVLGECALQPTFVVTPSYSLLVGECCC